MTRIRRADLGDIDALTRMRIDFLNETGRDVPTEGMDALESAIRRFFEEEMASGRFLAWLAEDDGEIVAASGLIFQRRLPTMNHLSGLDAYVLNMHTLPDHRRKGYATRLLAEMIRYVREETPAHRIWLRDTGIGRGIYERAGFVPCERDMELVWR